MFVTALSSTLELKTLTCLRVLFHWSNEVWWAPAAILPCVFLKLFSVVTCVSSRVSAQWCSITMIFTAVCFVCANRGDDRSRHLWSIVLFLHMFFMLCMSFSCQKGSQHLGFQELALTWSYFKKAERMAKVTWVVTFRQEIPPSNELKSEFT